MWWGKKSANKSSSDQAGVVHGCDHHHMAELCVLKGISVTMVVSPCSTNEKQVAWIVTILLFTCGLMTATSQVCGENYTAVGSNWNVMFSTLHPLPINSCILLSESLLPLDPFRCPIPKWVLDILQCLPVYVGKICAPWGTEESFNQFCNPRGWPVNVSTRPDIFLVADGCRNIILP